MTPFHGLHPLDYLRLAGGMYEYSVLRDHGSLPVVVVVTDANAPTSVVPTLANSALPMPANSDEG